LPQIFYQRKMYNREIKIVGAIALLGLCIWQFIEVNIGNGIFLMLLTALPIFLIFFNERMMVCLYQMKKNDLVKARASLDKIKAPEKLIKSQQAYYHFLLGNLDSQTNLNKAEKHFKKALLIGMRSEQDTAMIKLSLAGVAMSRRKKPEATRLLNEAKKMDKKNMLADQIKMFKQQLKKI